MILFALFVSCVTAAEYDHFHFHTSITCSLKNKLSYFYDIKFYEWDNGIPGSDDPVSDWTRGHIAPRGITNETYHGKEDGDINGGYELYAYIRHDCLLHGDPEYIEVHFITNYCQIGAGDCHIYVDIDLTGLISRKFSRELREVVIKQG